MQKGKGGLGWIIGSPCTLHHDIQPFRRSGSALSGSVKKWQAQARICELSEKGASCHRSLRLCVARSDVLYAFAFFESRLQPTAQNRLLVVVLEFVPVHRIRGLSATT